MNHPPRPRLLVVSHVSPLPGSAGQQQRVRYTLLAARARFHVTLALLTPPGARAPGQADLAELCDELIVLPSRRGTRGLAKAAARAAAAVYSVTTGLKRSNYVLGRVELTPRRILGLLDERRYDCVLFEYWHAWRAAAALRVRGVPTVLDTHNVLWQAYRRNLEAQPRCPRLWRRWAVSNYRRSEERAWSAFDGLIAINRQEYESIRAVAPPTSDVFYAPMGIDLSRWQYLWKPGGPVRIAYYGGLGSEHNQRDALLCATEVMPEIWKVHPAAELWLVGSNPPTNLQTLSRDPRIHVTGFVDDVPDILRRMSVVLCPWVGTYGFRSRLVEVLGVGVPLVASPDAIAGMDFVDGQSILLAPDPASMATHALRLIGDVEYAKSQSRLGRAAVEREYSNENTYIRLIDEMASWPRLDAQRGRTAGRGIGAAMTIQDS